MADASLSMGPLGCRSAKKILCLDCSAATVFLATLIVCLRCSCVGLGFVLTVRGRAPKTRNIGLFWDSSSRSPNTSPCGDTLHSRCRHNKWRH